MNEADKQAEIMSEYKKLSSVCTSQAVRLIEAESDVDELVEALRDLVTALNNTTWSSWQTTAHFQKQLDAAEAALFKFGEQS